MEHEKSPNTFERRTLPSFTTVLTNALRTQQPYDFKEQIAEHCDMRGTQHQE